MSNNYMAGANGVPRGPMGPRPFTASNTGATLLFPADEKRGYLLIQNNSGANMIIGLDSEPTLLTGLVLGPGVFWEPASIPTNAIYVLGTLPEQRGIAMTLRAE